MVGSKAAALGPATHAENAHGQEGLREREKSRNLLGPIDEMPLI